MKRISLLAGYDKSGIIHDYVIFLARSLSTFSDVYFLSDCVVSDKEKSKLSGIAKYFDAYRHGRYDFGSWADLIALVGWDVISQYDELILLNDSCYGPLFNIKVICDRMSENLCDFWGISANDQFGFHLQSYFMVFKKKIFMDRKFRKFWSQIEQQKSHWDIVKRYEIGLSRLLVKQGYKAAYLVKSKNGTNPCCYPSTLIRDFQVPLIKVKAFTYPEQNLFEKFKELKYSIINTNYDFSLIERHIGLDAVNNCEIVNSKSFFPIYRKFFGFTFYISKKKRIKIRFRNIIFFSMKLHDVSIEKFEKLRFFQTVQ